MRRLLGRLSPWTLRAFFVVVVLSVALGWNWWVSVLALAVLFTLVRVRPLPLADPTPYACRAPVEGAWVGLNSPADKIPSHGTHGYGQTYAIDLCGPSGRDEARTMTLGWRARAPEEFSAFGRPVVAVAPGTVVAATDRQRDHRSRESLPALLWMMAASGPAREIAGVRWILGNHVVVDHHDGTYALYAHLRRGSLAVAVGEDVAAGQQLAEVGNTGNTSEPHLHVHLMDDADPHVGRGIPFRWTNIDQRADDIDVGSTWGQEVSGKVTAGVPGVAQRFTVTTHAPQSTHSHSGEVR